MEINELLIELDERQKIFSTTLPSKISVEKFVHDIFYFLFPIKGEAKNKKSKEKLIKLKKRFKKIVIPIAPKNGTDIDRLVTEFFGALPEIYNVLLCDIDFFYFNDPAADSRDEVIATYPGFYAICVYRMSNLIYQMKLPILARMFSEYAHRMTGIDIHPGALIGYPFFIDHGTGIVIGQTTEIGNNVKIYQGVTLGALSVEKSLSNVKRHPTIEDNVIIYAGATILGGNTRIGKNTTIGGNVWITQSVMPGSMVYHKSQVIVKENNDNNEVINFSI